MAKWSEYLKSLSIVVTLVLVFKRTSLEIESLVSRDWHYTFESIGEHIYNIDNQLTLGYKVLPLMVLSKDS